MGTTISAMDLVIERRKTHPGRDATDVDQSAVEAIVSSAASQPRDKVIAVVQRIHSDILMGHKMRGPNGYMNLETMATIADRLAGL